MGYFILTKHPNSLIAVDKNLIFEYLGSILELKMALLLKSLGTWGTFMR